MTGVAYDFAANACQATWYSRGGQLPCPGTEGDAKGFVRQVSNPKLENGVADTRPGLLTFPSPPLASPQVGDGYIQGFYPAFTVQNGDRFRATVGCEYNSTICYVAFRLDYEVGGVIRQFAGSWGERYEGGSTQVDVSLNSLAGQNVRFILTVLSAGVNTGDRALWVGPHIYRANLTPVPTTPTTPVPTTPTTPVPTTPTTPVPTTPSYP